MIRKQFLMGFASFGLLFSGCSNPKVDELGKEKVRLMKEVADELEKAEKPGKLSKSEASLVKLEDEIKQLPWPTQEAIRSKFGSEIRPLQERIDAAKKKLTDTAGKKMVGGK